MGDKPPTVTGDTNKRDPAGCALGSVTPSKTRFRIDVAEKPSALHLKQSRVAGEGRAPFS